MRPALQRAGRHCYGDIALQERSWQSLGRRVWSQEDYDAKGKSDNNGSRDDGVDEDEFEHLSPLRCAGWQRVQTVKVQ